MGVPILGTISSLLAYLKIKSQKLYNLKKENDKDKKDKEVLRDEQQRERK